MIAPPPFVVSLPEILECDDNANGDPITDDNANGDSITCDALGPIIPGVENTRAVGRADDERPDDALQIVQKQRRKQRRYETLKIQKQACIVYPLHPLPRSKPRVTPGGSLGNQTGRVLPMPGGSPGIQTGRAPLSGIAAAKFATEAEEKARPLHAEAQEGQRSQNEMPRGEEGQKSHSDTAGGLSPPHGKGNHLTKTNGPRW